MFMEVEKVSDVLRQLFVELYRKNMIFPLTRVAYLVFYKTYGAIIGVIGTFLGPHRLESQLAAAKGHFQHYPNALKSIFLRNPRNLNSPRDD